MPTQETPIQITNPIYVKTPTSSANAQLFLNTADGNALYQKNSLGVSSPVATDSAQSATALLNFPSTPAQSSSDLTIALLGAELNDVIGLGVPSVAVLPNTSYTAFVSAPDVVTVRFNNYSALAADPTFGDFIVVVVGSAI